MKYILIEPAANRAVRLPEAGDDHAKAAKDCEGDELDDDDADHGGMPLLESRSRQLRPARLTDA